MHRNPSRPMSPHLTIWKWGPHMLVSILHRGTGIALSTAGAVALIWWLVAAASGPKAYQTFVDVATSWFGILVGVGLTWAFWQHCFSGLRHLILDIGAGYELRQNRFWSIMTMVGSAAATLITWAFVAEIF